MGFLAPKVPKAPEVANPAILAEDKTKPDLPLASQSLINTSAQGLKRRAETQRTSLIGGA